MIFIHITFNFNDLKRWRKWTRIWVCDIYRCIWISLFFSLNTWVMYDRIYLFNLLSYDMNRIRKFVLCWKHMTVCYHVLLILKLKNKKKTKMVCHTKYIKCMLNTKTSLEGRAQSAIHIKRYSCALFLAAIWFLCDKPIIYKIELMLFWCT